MPRIYQPGSYQPNDTLELSPSASQHVTTVLRLREGDAIVLFSGDSYDYPAMITKIHKKKTYVTLSERIQKTLESPCKIHLIQGISKNERMDWAIQKAVELGVHRITPVLTQHGSIKHDAHFLSKRHQHWQGIIISACEQSGRSILPLIDEPCLFQKGLSLSQYNNQWILDPTAPDSLMNLCDKKITEATLLIGPEGGFHASEIKLAMTLNYQKAHLGPRILRTETATATALTILQSVMGDLSS